MKNSFFVRSYYDLKLKYFRYCTILFYKVESKYKYICDMLDIINQYFDIIFDFFPSYSCYYYLFGCYRCKRCNPLFKLCPALSMENQKTGKREMHHHNRTQSQHCKTKRKITSDQDARFKHGNYNRYYGYRNFDHEIDIRVPFFKKEWFTNKCCLDVGCNVGHLTLWLAKYFFPKKMKGIDIDCELIKAAKNNISHYIELNTNEDEIAKTAKISDENVRETEKSVCFDSVVQTTKIDAGKTCSMDFTKLNTNVISEVRPSCAKNGDLLQDTRTGKTDCVGSALTNEKAFSTPIGCSEVGENRNRKLTVINVTNVSQSSMTEQVSLKCSYDSDSCDDYPKFPYNVSFVAENFVPASASVLKYTRQEYDVILCLSVTKWIQLNSGDIGLKLLFKKVYKLLNPGGIFLLEPQPYKSYKRRKNLTPEIRKNYDAMKLMPGEYAQYLLSDEVGFSKCEEITITEHEKEGFKRPLYLFSKD